MRVNGTGKKERSLLAGISATFRFCVVLSALCLTDAAAQLNGAAPAASAALPAAVSPAPVIPRLPEGIVARVELRGTAMGAVSPIAALIEQKPGVAVDREAIRNSIRRLYQTQLFETIDVIWEPASNGQVNLVFVTTPRYFCGSLSVDGLPKDGPRQSEMISTANLELGTYYSLDKTRQMLERMHRLLEEYGYYQTRITYEEEPDPSVQQMNLKVKVVPGSLAHVGRVDVAGDSDITLEDIEDLAGIYPGDKIRKDQVQHALRRLRKYFQKDHRLTAQVEIGHSYHADANTVDYTIEVRRGPEVDILAQGAKFSSGQLKRRVPIYQEGAVDEDLLNEGRRNLRDLLQTEGFSDATVDVQQKQGNDAIKVVYKVNRGIRHKLVGIRIEGNRYFDERTIRERLTLQPANWNLPHGRFSQAILALDILAIKNLYQANGFPNVEVTGNVLDNYGGDAQRMLVDFRIVEGKQVLVHSLTIIGNETFPAALLEHNLYTVPGQPYSEMNFSTDRDTLVNFYFNNGFPGVQFEASAKPSDDDPSSQQAGGDPTPQGMDVTYKIVEGERVYVQNVVISGLWHTRPDLVDRRFSIRDGDPLNQLEMVDTQARLYDLGIFNEVNMAVQNPGGQIDHKNLLYQIQEARRYTFQYGAGIEFGTGNQPGSNPQGNTGVSPTVSFNVTRINFRGRDESLIFKSQVGELIKRGLISFDQPHWFDLPKWHFTATFLYDNTRDVNTFTAERLGGSLQLEQRISRANRIFYGFSYRRDKVDPSSFPAGFSTDLLSIYAAPVRIGMPTVTFISDTRDDPIDSTKGIYTTADFGLATGALGSEASFGRALVQNATYHRLPKNYVFARSTRIGVESPYGSTSVVPLPEHFFAGGSTSLRGFGLNQAGPRDLYSGFPVGGDAMFVNDLELRTPAISLPLAGPGFSFVVFHDMGNVFDTASDMGSNLLRWSQRNQQGCVSLTSPCDFNFLSQSVGGGLRYHTPIGPVRLDFAYDLNPAYFAVQPQTANTPSHVEQLRHFNFFFSIGQTF